MGLAADWQRITAALQDDWEQAELRLDMPDEHSRARASALLSPLSPGRVGDELRIVVSRSSGVGPEAARRLLVKLDEEALGGRLTLSGSTSAAPVPVAAAQAPLAEQWDSLVAGLPEDWSDLLCLVELFSSDDVPRAALLSAPLNPSRPQKELGLEFRVARRFGYGSSPQMARRCLARLDEARIPGRLRLLRALSDTRPVATQGPVWYVGGKVL